jgi:hypothetical protein
VSCLGGSTGLADPTMHLSFLIYACMDTLYSYNVATSQGRYLRMIIANACTTITRSRNTALLERLSRPLRAATSYISPAHA